MTGEHLQRGRFDWLYAVAIPVGAALIAIGLWNNGGDGGPIMPRGEQPIEVVLPVGLGCALFLNGIVGGVRALKARRHSKTSRGVHPPNL